MLYGKQDEKSSINLMTAESLIDNRISTEENETLYHLLRNKMRHGLVGFSLSSPPPSIPRSRRWYDIGSGLKCLVVQ